MLATDDYPTRAAAHPPRLRGGLGRGFFNVLVAFGELVSVFAGILPKAGKNDGFKVIYHLNHSKH
jgi:hypothetical protein